ncbi:Acyl-CoA synthetase family member 2, mitochondrial [Eumeta japonica]|uniref:Medium-chain acyl-CoA ligase ACSF2, mitochondrial n=1 Tax=Eumeta variegata TaxID=151549 RepID=A0A4C1VUV1_EUMVA|nr:Acyl-CoA synthetase family member 2, mitochondrial [Eumeta japonica]
MSVWNSSETLIERNNDVLRRGLFTTKYYESLLTFERNPNSAYRIYSYQADRLAACLRGIGLAAGDRFGIWSPNSTQWIIATFAAARCGLISVALNPLYRKKEMEYCLKKVGVKALLAPEMHKNDYYYQILTEVVPEMAYSRNGIIESSTLQEFKHVVLLTDKDDLPGVIPYKKLMASACAADVAAVERDALAVDPDAGCNIQFTSGTTGNPKAALLSHHNIVNNGYYIGLRNELNAAHRKICVQVPLFHVFGLVITLSSAIQHGATLVLPSAKYSPTANVDALIAEQCDYVHGTPTMHIDLVNTVRNRNVTGLRVRTAVTGGSPVTPQLVQDLKHTLGLATVKAGNALVTPLGLQESMGGGDHLLIGGSPARLPHKYPTYKKYSVYGLTEATAVSFQSVPGEDPQRPLHYVGDLHDHLEAKIVDEKNNIVPFGATGELWIRGYQIMKGYWGDEVKTQETITPDGWLKSGDQMVLHEDGYGQIVGRLKDLIIRGGENIAPKEIEDTLTTHPDVVDCQVIGVHDDRLGEEVCAVVRLREGVELNSKKLTLHCQSSLAKYKVPKLFKQVDSFPKTASGKVQKHKLKNMIESGQL